MSIKNKSIFSRFPINQVTVKYFIIKSSKFRSKIVSLLRRLSPRLPRPSSKGSLPSSPSICPWVQVEYSSGGGGDVTDGLGKCDDAALQHKLQQESDYIYQREVRLNEIKKKAIVKGSPVSKVSRIFFRAPLQT